MMHKETDLKDRKPDLIKFYNATKRGIDVHDEMSSNMSCSRKTRCLFAYFMEFEHSHYKSWVLYL